MRVGLQVKGLLLLLLRALLRALQRALRKGGRHFCKGCKGHQDWRGGGASASGSASASARASAGPIFSHCRALLLPYHGCTTVGSKAQQVAGSEDAVLPKLKGSVCCRPTLSYTAALLLAPKGLAEGVQGPKLNKPPHVALLRAAQVAQEPHSGL